MVQATYIFARDCPHLEYGTHFFPWYGHDPNHGFKWAFFIAESLHEFQIHTHIDAPLHAADCAVCEKPPFDHLPNGRTSFFVGFDLVFRALFVLF